MKLIFVLYCAAVCIMLNPSPAFAQSGTTATIPETSSTAPAIIPEGTGIVVVLKEKLVSGRSQVGQTVHFEVAHDVVLANAGVVIPRGGLAFGVVTTSKREGTFGQAGKLAYTCDYVCLPHGGEVTVRSSHGDNYGSDDRGDTILRSVLITPLALLGDGGSAKAKNGQELTVYVDRDTLINGTPVVQAQIQAQHNDEIAKSLFTLTNGDQIVGTVNSFDGNTYRISTKDGISIIRTTDIKSIYALANDTDSSPPSTVTTTFLH